MATNPSEANTHMVGELMERISRLEAENRELKRKMEQNSGRNGMLGGDNESFKNMK